jgi:hypothetical protein
MRGFGNIVSKAFKDFDINPVKAENRLSHHYQKKTQNQNSKALSITTLRAATTTDALDA